VSQDPNTGIHPEEGLKAGESGSPTEHKGPIQGESGVYIITLPYPICSVCKIPILAVTLMRGLQLGNQAAHPSTRDPFKGNQVYTLSHCHTQYALHAGTMAEMAQGKLELANCLANSYWESEGYTDTFSAVFEQAVKEIWETPHAGTPGGQGETGMPPHDTTGITTLVFSWVISIWE